MNFKYVTKMKLKMIVLFLMPVTVLLAQRSIIVDADTGNEVDDLYALARILM